MFAACGTGFSVGEGTSQKRYHNAGDVIVGAALQGQCHQLVGPFLGIAVARGACAQIISGHEVGQAVAGQDEIVARLWCEWMHLGGIRKIATTEKFVENMAVGTLLGLLGSQGPAAEQSVGDGVVDSQLFDTIAANKVSAAVAESSDVDPIVLAYGQDSRGAHAPVAGLAAAGFEDGTIGF